ncbi:MAG: CoB--CoM heterodisulfide reductase iron-sulfur subunit B family protein [Candidatus Bathyarchaeia archaeon]
MAGRYAFFRGCFIPIRLPHIESAAIRVFNHLGIELVDVNGFTCCPEPVGFGINDRLSWLSIAARNISLAEERALDLVTFCNGCLYTLRHACHMLREGKLRGRVNEVLSETGHRFGGSAKVKHFLEVILEDVGIDRLRRMVRSPLFGLTVATHPGCHILSPPEVMDFDDPYDPVVLDDLVRALGAQPADYDMKADCCGWTLANFGQPDASLTLLAEKVRNMREAGADCMVAGCPQCFYQFDMGQLLAARKLGLEHRVPVFFYHQLLGLAMEYGLDGVQYPFHRIKDAEFESKVKSRR